VLELYVAVPLLTCVWRISATVAEPACPLGPGELRVIGPNCGLPTRTELSLVGPRTVQELDALAHSRCGPPV
jgi:hypothetical protein